MPDLTYFKVFVAKLDDDTYAAGYFNSGVVPDPLKDVRALSPLFAPYDEGNLAVVDLRGTGITLVALAGQPNPDLGFVLWATGPVRHPGLAGIKDWLSDRNRSLHAQASRRAPRVFTFGAGIVAPDPR